MCGRGHFGVRVRPRPQILRPRPHESVDKRPRAVRTWLWMGWGARMLNIQVQIGDDRGAVWQTVLNITLLVKWKTNKKADSSDITNVLLHYML